MADSFTPEEIKQLVSQGRITDANANKLNPDELAAYQALKASTKPIDDAVTAHTFYPHAGYGDASIKASNGVAAAGGAALGAGGLMGVADDGLQLGPLVNGLKSFAGSHPYISGALGSAAVQNLPYVPQSMKSAAESMIGLRAAMGGKGAFAPAEEEAIGAAPKGIPAATPPMTDEEYFKAAGTARPGTPGVSMKPLGPDNAPPNPWASYKPGIAGTAQLGSPNPYGSSLPGIAATSQLKTPTMSDDDLAAQKGVIRKPLDLPNTDGMGVNELTSLLRKVLGK